MASTGGLTRRRGGAASNEDGEDTPSSRVASPTPKQQPADWRPETTYTNSENGHKIAFDPRDISESAERSKQPKLTLMEEILLLGLKDKQVGLLIDLGYWKNVI
jgi:golgi phosphoprotein 3